MNPCSERHLVNWANMENIRYRTNHFLYSYCLSIILLYSLDIRQFLIQCSLTANTHSLPRMSLRQSFSRDSRQCRDYAEIIQSEQIHLWKDNGHQQVHKERGAAWVQAAHQTDSQDGELHLRWHVVINCCHTSAFCPPPWSAGSLEDLIWVVGGCLSQFQEQLYSFEILDWLLCEMFKQIDPFPASYKTAITFLNAQLPHWLTDSFTHKSEVEHKWTSLIWVFL